MRDDIKQTNTVVVFLLLLSIIFRYYKCSAPPPLHAVILLCYSPLLAVVFCDIHVSSYFCLRIKKSDILARGMPLTGIRYP